MLLEEARWLGETLGRFDVGALSPLLDLGSSTRTFREVDQSYIDQWVFAPLRHRSCRVHHVDFREGDGIDIKADLFDDGDYQRLRALEPRAVLCANMLEHVPDPAAAVERCFGLLPAGGLLVLTVPNSFPHHPDPIDTGFRPSPQRLAELVAGHDVRCAETVVGTTLLGELRRRRGVSRAAAAAADPGKWRSLALHLLWLWRPYKMSCLVAAKRPA